MGFTLGRRLCEQFVPCEWAWVRVKADGTKVYRAIGSSTSNDPAGETLSDWERMEYGDDGSLDETRE